MLQNLRVTKQFVRLEATAHLDFLNQDSSDNHVPVLNNRSDDWESILRCLVDGSIFDANFYCFGSNLIVDAVSCKVNFSKIEDDTVYFFT